MTNLSEMAWCTYSLEAACDRKKLVEALTTGTSATVMAVSDGSYKDTYWTAAGLLAPRMRKTYFLGELFAREALRISPHTATSLLVFTQY
jgi:hypothetical protein